jgi:hypothetical protein
MNWIAETRCWRAKAWSRGDKPLVAVREDSMCARTRSCAAERNASQRSMYSAMPVSGLWSTDIQGRTGWQEGGGHGASRRCRGTRRALRPCRPDAGGRRPHWLPRRSTWRPGLWTWVMYVCVMIGECRWLAIDSFGGDGVGDRWMSVCVGECRWLAIDGFGDDGVGDRWMRVCVR